MMALGGCQQLQHGHDLQIDALPRLKPRGSQNRSSINLRFLHTKKLWVLKGFKASFLYKCTVRCKENPPFKKSYIFFEKYK